MTTDPIERPGWVHGPASGIPAGGPGQGPASGIAARGTGTRPPFTVGNLATLTSGHRSPRVYGELAETLTAGLLDDRPDLMRYPEAVAAWATVEAQAALLRRHLADLGPLDGDGQPRATLLYWLGRLESAGLKHRAVLGLDPASEARLTRDRAAAAVLAVDLDGLAERGRAALAAREAAGLPAPPDFAGRVLDAARQDYAAERADAAERHAAAERAQTASQTPREDTP